jgi:hypothetical protein
MVPSRVRDEAMFRELCFLARRIQLECDQILRLESELSSGSHEPYSQVRKFADAAREYQRQVGPGAIDVSVDGETDQGK